MINNIGLQSGTLEYSQPKAGVKKNLPQNGTYGDLMECISEDADGRIQTIYYGSGVIASVGGIGGTVNVVYHKDSTPEDPMVIAWGTDALGKEYEETIHINDIDVRNASPAEMIALNAHLGDAGDPGVLWTALSATSAVSKMNFEKFMKGYIAMQRTAHNKVSADMYQYQLERFLFFSRQEGRKSIF